MGFGATGFQHLARAWVHPGYPIAEAARPVNNCDWDNLVYVSNACDHGVLGPTK